MVTTNRGVVFESRIGSMMCGISIALTRVDEWQRRIAGMSVSVAAVALGAVLAWLVSSETGATYFIGIALFLTGHIGLLATLTFTSSTPNASVPNTERSHLRQSATSARTRLLSKLNRVRRVRN